MNISLVSYSGRKSKGNCIKIMDYIADKYNSNKSYSFNLIKLNKLKISPCFNCDYDCFIENQSCKIIDDVKSTYNQLLVSDLIIKVIPVYSSAPPSLYFALRERSQCYFSNYDTYNKYLNIKKGFIVIGNKVAGANVAIDFIKNEHPKHKSNILLLESSRYNQKSVLGRLIENDEVKQEITKFTNSLL